MPDNILREHIIGKEDQGKTIISLEVLILVNANRLNLMENTQRRHHHNLQTSHDSQTFFQHILNTWSKQHWQTCFRHSLEVSCHSLFISSSSSSSSFTSSSSSICCCCCWSCSCCFYYWCCYCWCCWCHFSLSFFFSFLFFFLLTALPLSSLLHPPLLSYPKKLDNKRSHSYMHGKSTIFKAESRVAAAVRKTINTF